MTKTPAFEKYATKPVSAVHNTFIAWLEEHTGYPVDPQTVAIAINLHSTWQGGPENQKRIAEAKARRDAETVARAERKAARETAAAEKAAATAAPKPAPAVQKSTAKAGA